MSSPKSSLPSSPIDDDDYLRAIREDPDDDAPRLVYADVLQERGDPRGEFIVVDCARAKLEREKRRLAPEYAALCARERELVTEHGRTWFGIHGLDPFRGTFSRGFIEHVRLEVDELPELWPKLKKLPLRDLELLPSPGPGIALGHLVFVAEEDSSLSTISLEPDGYQSAAFDHRKVRAALAGVKRGNRASAWEGALPHPSLLPALDILAVDRLGPGALQKLTEQPLALKRLSFPMGTAANASTMRAFTASATFASLERLGGRMGDGAATAIFEATAPALRTLSMNRRDAGTFSPLVSDALARSTFLPALESLWADLALDEVVLRALTERATALEELILWREQPLRSIEALLAATSRLRQLSLAAQDFPRATVFARASFVHLEALSLKRFSLTAEDVRALPPVTHFHAYECRYEEGAKEAILDRWPSSKPS